MLSAIVPPAPGMFTTCTLLTSPFAFCACCSSRATVSHPPPAAAGAMSVSDALMFWPAAADAMDPYDAIPIAAIATDPPITRQIERRAPLRARVLRHSSTPSC